MSVSILGGDLTVYFTSDTGGSKQIVWTGSSSASATRSVNEVYSAMLDLFDNSTVGVGDYMDEGFPFKAITPTLYYYGRIETNDPYAWFIDPITIEHLTEGTIETVGWGRVVDSNTGIVVISGSTFMSIDSSDVGDTISYNNGGDTGTLLYVDPTSYELWIRPADSSSANNFFRTLDTLTMTTSGHTANISEPTPATGNFVWKNIYSIGTIQGSEQVYLSQSFEILPSYWPVGHMNRLIATTEFGNIINSGYVSAFIRSQNQLYDYFLLDTNAGSAIVAPLSSDNDLNNQTTGAISSNGITINFSGTYTADINNDTTNESYSILIDCASNSLSYVYEYLKYVTAYESANTYAGIDSSIYTGITSKLSYTSLSGLKPASGSIATGVTSGAKGIVVCVNTTDLYATIHSTQGTFITGENVTCVDGALTNTLVNLTSVIDISPKKQAPFGTFAGGKFFGAFGVLLSNVPSADVNNYELIADDGNVYKEPLQVSFELTNIKTDSEVRIYNNDILNSKNTEITGVESSTSALQSVSIVSGGSGYTVNDVLTIQGGTFTTASQLTVTEVDGSGTITKISISNAGSGYSIDPTPPYSVTGGTGSNATFKGTYSGTFSYLYEYSVDINITVVIFNLYAKDIRLSNLTLSNSNQSIPIQQGIERNYIA